MCFPRDVWVKGIIMLAASSLAVSLRRRSVVYAVGFALVADATIDIPLKPRLSSFPTVIGSTWSHEASVYFVGWHVLRCVSVTADILDGSPRGQPRGVFHTCLRALAYLLYFPGLIIGPVTNYDDFMKEPHRPSAWNHKRLLELLVRGCRLVARFFIMEAFLRWAYVRSALLAPRWYLAQSGWTLAGLVWLTSLQFYLKYNFAYGLSSLFFWMDGVYERHDLRPLCTMRIHTASNTWRYLYKPVVGGHWTPWRRFLGTSATFSFVLLWHSLQPHMVVWTLTNYFLVMAEMECVTLIDSAPVRSWRAQYSSPVAERVLKGVFCAFSLIGTFGSCFFFLTDYEIAGGTLENLLDVRSRQSSRANASVF
ncbi:protein-cysteine N-palmitoyltransferase HHAT-like isoform X2 [Amblyomma americanum]